MCDLPSGVYAVLVSLLMSIVTMVVLTVWARAETKRALDEIAEIYERRRNQNTEENKT